jgi:hypothetical protein
LRSTRFRSTGFISFSSAFRSALPDGQSSRRNHTPTSAPGKREHETFLLLCCCALPTSPVTRYKHASHTHTHVRARHTGEVRRRDALVLGIANAYAQLVDTALDALDSEHGRLGGVAHLGCADIRHLMSSCERAATRVFAAYHRR